MGYIRHHAIIVTSWQEEAIEDAHNVAEGLGCNVSNVVDSKMNGYKSFFVAPDGSKEGWTTSNEGDARRAKLLAYLDGKRYEDGSSCLKWVELQFGDDEGDTRIVSHSEQKEDGV